MARCTHTYRDTPKARAANKVGAQCGAAQVNDTPFCKFHGGASQQTIEKAQRERFEDEIRAELPKFTDMWPEDHAMLDPFSILLWDIRRSGARIEWFDTKIDELEEEKSIWWGKTKEEVIGAAEFTGTNKTYEARENVLVKMQDAERKTLRELRAQWQNDRFEAARVAGMGAFGSAARAMLRAICDEFEIDLTSEDVQHRVQHALGGLPDPIPAITAQGDVEVAREKAGRKRPGER